MTATLRYSDEAITAAPEPPSGADSHRLTNWWSDTRVFAVRNIEHIRQIPEKLLDVTIQPLMFVLLFAYVFGGAIAVQGGNYREYLIAGILIQSLTFGALPTTRAAYLSGHFLAELGGLMLSIVILLTAGVIVGWRVHTDPLHLAVAGLLLVLFSAAMVWIGTWVGLLVRAPDAAMGIGFTVVFPITFVSAAFVPVSTLPDVLQWFAVWNPITVMTAAMRELFGNPTAPVAKHSWPLDHPVLCAFLFCAALLAIAIPMSLRRFRARTSD
jgi:ABC-2 type transport system permease protein